MMHQKLTPYSAFLLISVGGTVGLTMACSRNEPAPSNSNTGSQDDDEKPKKKKKSKSEMTEDESPVKNPTPPSDETPTTPTIRTPTPIGVKTTPTSTSTTTSDADKQKLMRCCSALRTAAHAAGVASTLASGIPGLPTVQTSKTELDKAVDACDKQVSEWTGDLNKSLTTIKGATQVKLPQACSM